MQLSLSLIVVAFASLGAASPAPGPDKAITADAPVLVDRQSCPPSPGWCDRDNCQGENYPWNGLGICTAAYKDCSCRGVCDGKVNSCYANGCGGPTDDHRCKTGKYKGCWCKA